MYLHFDSQNLFIDNYKFIVIKDGTFQEISWNQAISDRKKELQEKLNSVSR